MSDSIKKYEENIEFSKLDKKDRYYFSITSLLEKNRTYVFKGDVEDLIRYIKLSVTGLDVFTDEDILFSLDDKNPMDGFKIEIIGQKIKEE